MGIGRGGRIVAGVDVEDDRAGTARRVPVVEIDVVEVAVLGRARLAEDQGQDLGGPAAGEEVHAEDTADRRAAGHAQVEDAGLQVGPGQAGAVGGLDVQLVHGDQRDGHRAADAPDVNG